MENQKKSQLKIISSQVKGLDFILGGGFVEGSMYIVEGMPGSGKTILGNEIVHRIASEESKAAFITLMVETHGKMLDHLRQFSFFNEDKVGTSIHYFAGYQYLREGRIPSFKKFIIETIRSLKLKFLIIDGFKVVHCFADRKLDFSNFLHELNSAASSLSCTIILLSISSPKDVSQDALVDGIIELQTTKVGLRDVRTINIDKIRGNAPKEGKHVYIINNNGISIFPRIESLPFHEYKDTNLSAKLQFGIKSLDQMLEGGIVENSTTCLFGPPGAGKTVFGLKFIEDGLKKGEKCVIFGFYETPNRLISKAEKIGIDLRKYIENGMLKICWYPPTEHFVDQLTENLLQEVDRYKASRLFIDGVDGFEMTMAFPYRLPRVLAALGLHLRFRGVTSIWTQEVKIGSEDEPHDLGFLSPIYENIIYIRYMEVLSKTHRLISVYKVRESSYDTSIREFRISAQGVEVDSNSFNAKNALKEKSSKG